MKNTHHKLTTAQIPRPLRRAIMLFLFLAFFILSPIIIFYTAGYRYDFQEKKIKQTGVLSVDIEPKDSLVYLNGIQIKKTLPVRLPNRAPGVYHILLQKDGYHAWEKDITISSNQTTYIKDVTLIKKSSPEHVLSDLSGIQHIYGTPYHTTFLILTHNDMLYEVHTFDTKTQTSSPLLRTASTQKPKIHISPFSPYAYIIVKEEEETILYLLSLNQPDSIISYTYSASTPIETQWNKSTSNNPLYTRSNNTIELLSINQSRSIVTSTDAIHWYIDNKQNIWTYNTKTLSNIYTSATYDVDDLKQIIDINENRALLRGNNIMYILTFLKDKTERFTIPGNNFTYLRDTREWNIWSDWELYALYDDGGTNLLNRGGEKMYTVALLDENGVLVYTTDNATKTFNPGYFVSHTLLENIKSEYILPITQQRELYYMSSEDEENKLYKLDY